LIGILEYGMGNVGSIKNMLNRISVPSELVSDSALLDRYDRLILPGVGSFDAGMTRLEQSGLRVRLNELAMQGMPVLGICLGMQLLGRRSEEGKLPGLGWIQADVVRFVVDSPSACVRLKVPHMGWNVVSPVNDPQLFQSLANEPRFYFVHSYHMVCDDPADVIATVNYGGPVTAAVRHGNVQGAQFHPEKSHKFGMKLLENFSKC
jgi:imidazole glycerol-phosphate synthase subunit HisH